MASAEPPKKRKHFDAFPDPPPILTLPPAFISAPTPAATAPAPLPPRPPSPEEILRRRRNREEIRSLVECYRRIRFCATRKDALLMPDLEQAYLSLITASRGCTSVQRIVAELIPRYASFCPTALEAAAKVSINMYNWSLAIIMKGEDVDGVAFQTAKACIFGLFDICCSASNEAPTSSVIRGICAAVFLNVLSFFTMSFEGQDIYRIGSREIQKLQEPIEFIYNMKQESADNSEPELHKLFELRALCFLCIFISFPKNVLSACFELFVTGGNDIVLHKRGQYFLNQVTSHIQADDVNQDLDEAVDGALLCADSALSGTDCKGTTEAKSVANFGTSPNSSLQSNSCFMEMVVKRDPLLKGWTLSRYKKLQESLNPQVISDISSSLGKVFGSLPEVLEELNCEDSDEENFDPSKYINHPYLVRKSDNNVDASKKELSLGQRGTSTSDALCKGNDSAGKGVGHCVDPQVSSHEVNRFSRNENSIHIGERMVSIKSSETGDPEDVCLGKASTSKELISNRFPSATRQQQDFKNFDSRREGHEGLNIDIGTPPTLPGSGGTPRIWPVPKQHSASRNHASHPILWHLDGDSAAMDVISASKQLWLGSLGRDASETLIRLQFEDFGPLENFLYFPAKDFAIIEYRNILDAVRAREYMKDSSPWGSSLRVKFLDRGLGSEGAVNGVAVGDSCHVYIGKVSNQRAKDEILRELMVVGVSKPRVVTDLTSENALLLEFDSAEEAVTAMAHIRHQRRETAFYRHPNKSLTLSGCTNDKFYSGCQLVVRQIDASVFDAELINAFSKFGEVIGWRFNRQYGCCYIDFQSKEAAYLAKSHLHGARFGPMSIHVEVRMGNTGTDANRFAPSSGFEATPLREPYPLCLENKPGNPCVSPFVSRPENNVHELLSPRLYAEKFSAQVQSGHAFRSNWHVTSTAEKLEVGSRKVDDVGSSTTMDLAFAEGPATTHGGEIWQHKKQDNEPKVLVQGTLPCPAFATHGGSVIPPPPIQTSFVRPVYFTPSSSWENRSLNPPMTQISSGAMPSGNRHINACPAIPFIPCSVTPLSQLSGASMQRFEHMTTAPSLPSAAPPPPPPPDMLPPLPSSPPPLPLSQPPSVPPPPSSPPPLQPSGESSNLHAGELRSLHQWQGTLSKSGVHYCTVYATREDSVTCKYSNAVSEPADWPARLDVTKRTDIRHVRTTFSNTPPNRREVCRLLPSSTNDRKGLHDFVSYLKQRECAGVIKIPAGKFMWARLLFILPCSADTCSLLAITPHPAECLITVVLPKETNSEIV